MKVPQIHHTLYLAVLGRMLDVYRCAPFIQVSVLGRCAAGAADSGFAPRPAKQLPHESATTPAHIWNYLKTDLPPSWLQVGDIAALYQNALPPFGKRKFRNALSMLTNLLATELKYSDVTNPTGGEKMHFTIDLYDPVVLELLAAVLFAYWGYRRRGSVKKQRAVDETVAAADVGNVAVNED